jgi:transposase InsO family protein
VIVAFIDAYRDRFGVVPICTVLSEHGMPIAPSTYYAAKARPVSAAELADAYAANALWGIWTANRRVYGVRKLWHEVRRQGHGMGRDQVARLMGILGIAGVVRGEHRVRTTESDPAAPRHPDLVKRAWGAPTGPDQLWVADFTYAWTLAGFVYVAFCVDVFSRRILGWTCSASKATRLVSTVVEQAVSVRRRANSCFTATGIVHHSDAGSQYTALAFTKELLAAGILGSIGTVGDALDNALMESTIGLFKTELIGRHQATWADRDEVETATADWVHWYNHTRLHSSIGYLPPVEFEQHHQHASKTADLEPEAA